MQSLLRNPIKTQGLGEDIFKGVVLSKETFRTKSRLYQAKRDCPNHGYYNRELKGFLDAKTELSPTNLIIITEDEEGIEKMGDTDVEIIPLWKWLLKG